MKATFHPPSTSIDVVTDLPGCFNLEVGRSLLLSRLFGLQSFDLFQQLIDQGLDSLDLLGFVAEAEDCPRRGRPKMFDLLDSISFWSEGRCSKSIMTLGASPRFWPMSCGPTSNHNLVVFSFVGSDRNNAVFLSESLGWLFW